MKTIIEETVMSYGEDLENRVAAVEVSAIKTSKALRAACEQNYCGNYDKNWMCPPAIGTYEELSGRLKEYNKGVLVQTIHTLQDSFDYEGMKAGKEKHERLFRNIRNLLMDSGDYPDLFTLSTSCSYCESCSILDNEPCRFPEHAVASVSAYGINVNALLTRCGLKYNNGENTVYYLSLFLQ